MTASRSTNPQNRLSQLWSRLSPMAKYFSGGHHNFAVVNVLKNFVRPFGLHVGLQILRTARREIVSERVIRRGGIADDVRLADPLPVDVHLLVHNLDAVAGNSDHALDVMRVILKRKFENDNVPAANFAIRKNMVVPVFRARRK